MEIKTLINTNKTYIRNQTPSASRRKNCKNLFGEK